MSDGYYKIESKLSGKVLDVANGSRTAGANVWQYSWNGSDAQLWRFVDAGDGKYYIQSKLGTVLDLSLIHILQEKYEEKNKKDNCRNLVCQYAYRKCFDECCLRNGKLWR